MAFPSTNVLLLSEAFSFVRQSAATVKSSAQTLRALSLGAAIAWIIANFPKDANGYLLATQFTADGRTTERTFNSASLANLRTQLDALIATID